MLKTVAVLVLGVVSIVSLAGCQNPIKKAVRDVEYSAYELVGYQKRDLLKSRIDTVREEQEEAGEEFSDALEKLKAVYAFDGGELEKRYRALNSSYEDAEGQAKEVRDSIKRVENVAGDLFTEWEKEIGEIKTKSLADSSKRKLRETKNRYEDMHKQLKSSEAKMDPVLGKFKDQVLFLKHNLNAKAIGSLKSESQSIQKEIQSLIKEVEASSASASAFIKQMESLE